MADTKITGVAELDAIPAVGDWIPFVDVSDTTMSASGTTKRINADRLIYTTGTANTLAANLNANSVAITGAGAVAIGTATQSRPFHLHGTGDTYARFSSGNNSSTGMDIGYGSNVAYIWNYENSNLSLATNNSIVMSISPNGRVGIGTITPGAKLYIRGGNSDGIFLDSTTYPVMRFLVAGSAAYEMFYDQTISTFKYGIPNTAVHLLIDSSGNVGVGVAPSYKFDVNGAAHASSFPTSSDRRLKENLQPVRNVLGKLDQLNAYTFTWKDEYRANSQFYEPDVDVPDSEFETDPTTEPVEPTEPTVKRKQRQLGFVAQEVRKVFPELVTTWKHEYADDKHIKALAVDYGRMVPILVQGIKELVDRGQALQARVIQLETKVAALGGR